MSSKVYYQQITRQPPLVRQLHAHARKVLPPGSHIVNLADMAALGRGDAEAGERILHRMFKMAAPGAVHPHAIRDVGNGSPVKGRRVIEAFFNHAREQHENAKPTNYADGDQVDDAEFAADQPVPKPVDWRGGDVHYERVPLAKFVWQPDGYSRVG